MRNKFEMQLDELNNDLIAMGALCESAIAAAAKALTEDDRIIAAKAIRRDKEINRKERDIEALCLRLLLQQQPVAKDLRQISAALKMVTDMERIGDQAADICEIAVCADLPKDKGAHICEMANAVIKMVTNCVDAYVRQDLKLANEVIAYDDVVDGLFCSVRSDIINMILEDSSKGETALDVIMIAKYFERIGDHCTNVAEWVVFSITGLHKELQ